MKVDASFRVEIYPDFQAQLLALVGGFRSLLGEALVGVYLHGSLTMGCFNPKSSDLDLLVVTSRRLPVEIKRELVMLLLAQSRHPAPVEISFLAREHLRPWQHPTPYDLHFSEDWRTRFEQELASGSWRRWNDQIRLDGDLAGHITILRARGRCLYGEPIENVFPEVPGTDYAQSIVEDARWAFERYSVFPVYLVLNYCRILAFFKERLLLSKSEGGRWGFMHLDERWRPLIEQALALYQGEAEAMYLPPDEVHKFAEAMLAWIEREYDEWVA